MQGWTDCIQRHSQGLPVNAEVFKDYVDNWVGRRSQTGLGAVTTNRRSNLPFSVQQVHKITEKKVQQHVPAWTGRIYKKGIGAFQQPITGHCNVNPASPTG